MSKYDTEVDATNLNTSHALLLDLVGHNKLVLDVGCATGYLARELAARGCRVSGVELDPVAAAEAAPFLDRIVVGDLEGLDLVEAFGEASFDVVVFGDVLEHLRDPLVVLQRGARLLRPGGSVVLSVPHIAHGAVRLALLEGRFEYRSLGLLDATHLRFFTRSGLDDLLRQSGLVPVDYRRTTAGLFETEIPLDAGEFPQELVERILADPDATTYQFVLRAVRDDGQSAVADLARRVEEARVEVHDLRSALAAVTHERDELGRIAYEERERHLGAEEELLKALDRATRAEESAAEFARAREAGKAPVSLRERLRGRALAFRSVVQRRTST